VHAAEEAEALANHRNTHGARGQVGRT
jgi:hypothetical protein